MRATAEMEDVSFNTAKKLLADAGRACAAYDDEVTEAGHEVRAAEAGLTGGLCGR